MKFTSISQKKSSYYLNILHYTKYILVIIFFIQCNGISYRSNYTENSLSKIIEDSIIKSANSLNLKGISVSIVQKNNILFQNGYGISSYNNNSQVNENTIFKIGSVTKIFTALLIMKLYERGKINLDKEINFYLKDFNMKNHYNSPIPTVRQLLIHHAGLPGDIFQGFTFSEPPPAGYESEFRNLPLILKNHYYAQPPNKTMAYSNLSYSILALIIERVSGKDLEEFAKEEIFSPLEMMHTSYLDNLNLNLSKGFNGREEVKPPKIRDLGAGSISSSTADMSHLLVMFLNEGKYNDKQIFKDSTIKEMLKIQNDISEYDGDFKIGIPFWIEKDLENNYLYNHGGDLPPFHAYFSLDLKNKIGIISLTNTLSSSMFLRDLSFDIYRNITGKKISSIPLKQTKIDSKFLEEISSTFINPSSLLKLEKTGEFLKTNLGPIYLENKNNISFSPIIKLFFGLVPIRLNALGDLEFRVDRTKDNTPYITLKLKNLPVATYIKYQPVELPDSWNKRLGKYKVIDNKDSKTLTDVSLELEDSILKLKGKLKISNLDAPLIFYLKPLNENLAITEGVGRNSGEAVEVRNEEGSEILYFSGFKLKR